MNLLIWNRYFLERGKYHKRYDYILISDHFHVRNVEYRFDEAVQAGSDHAMVVADLQYK
ncbi:endonuclease/exonuclease/phosphatase family protein [Bacillus timonensis]|uniref:hypothetical protein n=1 Tax=Bacillus timonensis TaxID=1033734 RepID=UPI0002887793|nr:hypothetical protein [Bacillus timonensis]